MELKTYKIVESTVGKPDAVQRIVFHNLDEMMAARKSIEDGEPLLLEDDSGIVTHFNNHDINYLVYEGKVVLCAKKEVTK